MRIVFGQRYLNLAWFPLFVFVALAMFPEEILQTFFRGPHDAYREITETKTEGIFKLTVGMGIILTIARLNRLSSFLRTIFYLTVAYVVLLALESYFKYGTFFMYPHVFSKIMVLFLLTGGYIYFRNVDEKWVIASLLFLTAIFLFDMLVHYRDRLNISSFIDIERGLHASCIFLMMLPWLYSFNTYLKTSHFFWLATFFVLTGFILFLNHRTVWMTSFTSMALNIYLIKTKGKEHFSSATLAPVFVLPLIAGILVFAFVFSENPDFLGNIVERVVDIKEANKQGTGEWRLQQFQSYLPFIFDHPFIGMRMEGFELPVQFIARQTGKEVFLADTGHHFHSYYVDSLFYHGLAGLAILSAPAIYFIRKALSMPYKLNFQTIAWICWIASCFQYGFSYPWNPFHYAVMGVGMALIDNNEEREARGAVAPAVPVANTPVYKPQPQQQLATPSFA